MKMNYLRLALTATLVSYSLDFSLAQQVPPVPYRDVLEEAFAGAKLGGEIYYSRPGSADEKAGSWIENRDALFTLQGAEGSSIRVIARRTYVCSSSDVPVAWKEGASSVSRLDEHGGKLVAATAFEPDHLMVKFKEAGSVKTVSEALPDGVSLGTKIAELVQEVAVPDKYTPGQLKELLTTLQQRSDIEYALPDFVVLSGAASAGAAPKMDIPSSAALTIVTPVDPRYPQQYNLMRIGMPKVWAVVTSGAGAIAVLDSGIQQPPNVDLGTALIDLTRAKNFTVSPVTSNVTDSYGHGTQVSSISGAKGNNLVSGQDGICGVCWDVKTLPMLTMKYSSGVGMLLGNASSVLQALNAVRTYNASTNDIYVTNHSWYTPTFDIGLFAALNNSQAASAGPANGTVTGVWSGGGRTIALTGMAGDLAKISPGIRITSISDATTGGGIYVLYKYYDAITSKTTLIISGVPYPASGSGAAMTFSNNVSSSAYGTVNVVSAGDYAYSSAAGVLLDSNPVFPACFPSDLLITVGASTNPNDLVTPEVRLTKSNYSARFVHLFAPGENILCLNRGTPNVVTESGSDFAAPHVSGAIALYIQNLLNASQPVPSPQAIISTVKTIGTTTISGLNGFCETGGRLNVSGLLGIP